MSLTREMTGSWFDDVEEGGQLVDFLELAGQRGRKIESETIDMHFGDPVAQAVRDELQRVRRAHQQGVAGAGRVEVVGVGRCRPDGSRHRCRCL